MTAPQAARSGAPAARVSETPGDTAQPGVSQTTGRGSGSPRPVPEGDESPLQPVIGLDLSLSATGIAMADGTTRAIKTSPGDHLRDQHDRLSHIVGEIVNLSSAGFWVGPVLAVVEGPSYNSSGAGTWDRAGLWWLTVARLLDESVPVAVIPPALLKKYATGKGNATKPDMRVALLKRTGLDLRDDNQVDAWWLRAMGLDHLGQPPAVMPAIHRAALDKVAWPEGITS